MSKNYQILPILEVLWNSYREVIYEFYCMDRNIYRNIKIIHGHKVFSDDLFTKIVKCGQQTEYKIIIITV